ncbi:longevity-assurance domain-containing protein, putative [Eimeria necatrix]|uniref:Longevity-assurance domain-containing protein, putative n=1 Tax=Eimeria necatrix TaxID=51315 RepID=U6MHE8_9EIME|nr:longevity-assurance domain-containing protein, putative [Eimeria necatrix]CDJ63456.1 longevity-assurance domain-containing protein, putative [Eimeria necatrix]
MKLEAARQLISSKLQSIRMEDGTLVYHTLQFLVESERGPLWKQYLLNPSISFDDVVYVFVCFIVVMILRLVISGGSSGALRQLPCISKRIAKSFDLVRPGKLHKFGENVCELLHAACPLLLLLLQRRQRRRQQQPMLPGFGGPKIAGAEISLEQWGPSVQLKPAARRAVLLQQQQQQLQQQQQQQCAQGGRRKQQQQFPAVSSGAPTKAAAADKKTPFAADLAAVAAAQQQQQQQQQQSI